MFNRVQVHIVFLHKHKKHKIDSQLPIYLFCDDPYIFCTNIFLSIDLCSSKKKTSADFSGSGSQSFVGLRASREKLATLHNFSQ